MGSDTADSFHNDGPKHITDANRIDWGNEEHRRCIAACLVKGVYVLENDRAMSRIDTSAALASAWSEKFHFHLEKPLREDHLFNRNKQPIFGAIFKHDAGDAYPSRHLPPRYVVAFRGTMLRNVDRPVRLADLHHDGNIVTNTLEKRKRFKIACQEVKELMKGIPPTSDGRDNVWLAGHSLGASMALLVGKDMMEPLKLNLPTFLFNPPQVSLTVAMNLLNPTERAQRDLHRATTFLKFAAGRAFSSHRERMRTLLMQLSPWVPNLYVNNKDLICRGFIDYFERREEFENSFPGVGSWSMTLSYRDMLSQVFHKDMKQPHLLPSAMMWESRFEPDAHGLQQWWKPNGEIGLGTGTRYSYRAPQA